MNTCIKCGAPCRNGRFRCDDCQTIVERQRGDPLPPPMLITDRFNPTRKITTSETTAGWQLYEAIRALDNATPGGLSMNYPADVMDAVQAAIDAWEQRHPSTAEGTPR